MATDPVLSDPLLTSAGSHVTPAARSLNLRLGARLFVAADAFVFLAFLFAYLYLRSLNQHGCGVRRTPRRRSRSGSSRW